MFRTLHGPRYRLLYVYLRVKLLPLTFRNGQTNTDYAIPKLTAQRVLHQRCFIHGSYVGKVSIKFNGLDYIWQNYMWFTICSKISGHGSSNENGQLLPSALARGN